MSSSGPEATFTVALRVEGAPAAVQRAAIAAVPGRFRLVDGPVADVVVVGSHGGAWPELVAEAVREGVRGIMIAGRSSAPTGAAHDTLGQAAAAGIPVVIHTPYAATAAWRSVVAEVVLHATSAGILDSVASWPVAETDQAGASHGALLDQLAVVRPSIEDCDALRIAHSAPGGYEIVAAGRLVTTLTGVGAPVCDARLDLDLVSADFRWRVRFDTGAAARPVVIQRMDGDGVRESRLRFESGARACWVALHEQMTGTAPVIVDAAFLTDLDVAQRLLPA